MAKWLVKQIDDTTFELKYKVNTNQKPRGRYHIIESDQEDRETSKVQLDVDGKLEVVEDAALKTIKDDKASVKANAKSSLNARDLDGVWSALEVQAALKEVIRLRDS